MQEQIQAFQNVRTVGWGRRIFSGLEEYTHVARAVVLHFRKAIAQTLPCAPRTLANKRKWAFHGKTLRKRRQCSAEAMAARGKRVCVARTHMAIHSSKDLQSLRTFVPTEVCPDDS